MRRSSGILLHPVSLPSRHGIGAVGRSAFAFVDFLAEAGQQVWQVLPLGPTGFGDSPYNALSAFAGNPLLIDLDDLVVADDLQQPVDDFGFSPVDRIDYPAVREAKTKCLRQAADRFFRRPETDPRRTAYEEFCREQAEWLDDYALFMALRESYEGQSWLQWPSDLRLRKTEALAKARQELAETIRIHCYEQFVFARQWAALKTHAAARDVRLFGDMPIFVAFDSADVWAHQDHFQLDPEGRPTAVAGVPPDYFSATGQLWGNPLYRWTRHAEDGFAWWLRRFRHKLKFFDLLRIDHFRGFEACWSIPAGEKTAVNGHWEEVPGHALFKKLCAVLPEPPIIAEDLGVITDAVEALRDEFGFPGMKVLQFAFDSGADNPYLPHNHRRRAVVYTGTHDNDTTLGWWQDLPAGSRRKVCRYLDKENPTIPWDLIRLAQSSVADLCIIPCQDLLALGKEARLNRPGQANGNWDWRLPPGRLDQDLAGRLRELTAFYNRCCRDE